MSSLDDLAHLGLEYDSNGYLKPEPPPRRRGVPRCPVCGAYVDEKHHDSCPRRKEKTP
jgi:hypothetical protein